MELLGNLNWSILSWQDFQTLTIHLAQNVYPDTKFEEYLKQGNNQEGIDLQSFIRSDGTYMFIQCKREKKLTVSDLYEIVNEFEYKKHGKFASEFLLATTADLQNPKVQELLRDTAIRLKKKKITFKYWDINYIEEQLKQYYTLVQYYFSKEDSDRHCFRPFSIPPRFKNHPVHDFIPRRVYEFNIKDEAVHTGFFFGTKTYSLNEIFEQNRFLSKQICIIADAYQGKSYLLRNSAWELENIDIPYKPILVNIKNFPVQSIEILLNQLYGEWRSIPAKDLILIFDGLDEVPADQFEEAVKHINVFSISYPFISIIFSCRKLFYTRHRVASTLHSFNTYELYPLQYYNVNDYLKKKLGPRLKKFEQLISRAEITNLLYHPFYLVNLVTSFSKPPYQLPSSKIQVLNNFIENSFKEQDERRISSGQLHQKVSKYKKAIQKLAFALQLSGLNSFTDEYVQELFDDTEIELLQQNTLVSFSGNHWSFNNALFQEHLAALILSNLPFEQILNHVTVGNKIKKIKSKWIQTISSLISILEDSDPRLKQLVNFIKNDNIELIFTAENSKFKPEFRFDALKALITRLRTLKVRPLVILEENIASFIEHDVVAVKWLINQLTHKKYSNLNKATIIRTLKNISSLHALENTLLKKASLELDRTTDPYLAGLVFETMAVHKIGTKEFIQKMTDSPISQEHYFRDGLYELIMELDLVDDFYDFALDGYKALIQHNKRITHGGSEINLKNLLFASNKPRNLKKLFLTLQHPDWIDYYDRHSFQAKDFIKEALKKASDLFHIDNTIIFPVIGYTKILARKHIRDEYFKEIEQFFDDTNSHNLAIRIIIDDILNNKDWELCGLIRENVFDYILFEFEEQPLNLNNLRSCLSSLYHRQKRGTFEKLNQVIKEYTEGQIYQQDNAYSEYQEYENQKRKNDLKYIKSQSNFRKGILNFFKAHGKDVLTGKEMYVEFENTTSLRKKCDSNFIFYFLLRWIHKEMDKVFLKEALDIIDNNEWFEYYRAKEIMDYNFFTQQNREPLEKILENYFQTEVPKANFENSIWEVGNTTHYNRKAKLLGRIFEKHAFKIDAHLMMELVWVDISEPRSLEHHYSDIKKSISKLILENLPEQEISLFRQKILNHIKIGIKSSSVLGNHLGLCKHLQIVEAVDLILPLILNNQLGNLFACDVIEIYLALGGDVRRLLPYFRKITDYNSYDYIYLSGKLQEVYPEEIIKSYTDCLNSPDTKEERKLDIAAQLSNLGQELGFLVLIGFMRTKKIFPDLFHSKLDIRNLDTAFVLKQLKGLVYMILDPVIKSMHIDESPKHTIIDWLYSLASKSEQDLEKVVNFIYTSKKELDATHTNSSEMLWYATNAVERFRDSDKTVKTLSEVKIILAGIN